MIERQLLVTVEIDGYDVVLTGEFVLDLIKRYEAGEKYYIKFNLTEGTGHTVLNKVGDVQSLLKSVSSDNTVVQSVAGVEVKFKVCSELEAGPLLQQLAHNQVFVSGILNLNSEKMAKAAGEAAYKEALLLRGVGRFSYSLNADPNIRRHRAEQAYRSMYRK